MTGGREGATLLQGHTRENKRVGIFSKKKVETSPQPATKPQPKPPDEPNSTSTWTQPVVTETKPPEGFIECSGFQPCLNCSRGPVALYRSTSKPIKFICRACGEITSTLRLKRDGIDLDGKAAIRTVTKEQWLQLLDDEPSGAFDVRKIESTRPDGFVEDANNIQQLGQLWDELFVLYIPTDLVDLSTEVSEMQKDRTAFFEKGLAVKDKSPEDISFLIKCVSEILHSNYAFQYGLLLALKEVKDKLGLEQITPIPVSTPTKRAAAKSKRTKATKKVVTKGMDYINQFMDEEGFDSQADMLSEFRKNRKGSQDDDE